MKILLTGGSGDLGTILAPQLVQRGDTTISFDVRSPQTETAVSQSSADYHVEGGA